MPKQSDLEIALQNGLFLNKQYIRAYQFNQEERIPKTRCYNCQCFEHIAKTCNRLPKRGKCSEGHATSDCIEQAEMKCANCQLNHHANDTNGQTYLAHATKKYNQRNISIPSFLQEKIDSLIWNHNDWREQNCDTAVEPNWDIGRQAKCIKCFNDLKPDFVALNVTKSALPHDYFNNYRTFSEHQNTNSGGVALSLPIEVSCCEINSLQRTTFDSVWCLVHM